MPKGGTKSGRLRAAAVATGARMYSTGKPCKRGHPSQRWTRDGTCVECVRENARQYNADHPKEMQARWNAYHARNPQARTEAMARWRRNHPDKHAHLTAARQARKRRAVPKWADKGAIRRFYKACPDGYHVDHIIPLNHPRLCGLHVLENLQYLDAEQNKAKSNNYVICGEDLVIVAQIPWRDDGNLGLAYNEVMESMPDGSWVIFKDHDCMTTTSKWNIQIAEAIAFKPEAGAFVAMANRIASPWQRAPGVPSNNNDMGWHRKYGHERLKVRTLLDITNTKGWGGVMFALSRDVWKQVGGFEHGLGCADHSLHFKLQRNGFKVWLIEGLYLYHWRHWGEEDPTSIFPKVPNCPCRGPETAPTLRISLP